MSIHFSYFYDKKVCNDFSLYSRKCLIHNKFTKQGELISRIPQSILNQFSYNFTHTVSQSRRDYPENFTKYVRS